MRFWKILIIFLPISLVFADVSQAPITFQSKFISSILSETKIANEAILLSRNRIKKDHRLLHLGLLFSAKEIDWLQKTSAIYEMSNFQINKNSSWQELLSRVDIIPASLVVAQAIYESNWGRSRFAKEGNNYFGQRCYRLNCGMVPKQRPQGSKFEVRRFSSKTDSVANYIFNLNTHYNYAKLRKIRSDLRKKNREIKGYLLAEGLDNYSAQKVYVKNIRHVIMRYDLEQFDRIHF